MRPTRAKGGKWRAGEVLEAADRFTVICHEEVLDGDYATLNISARWASRGT